MTNKIFGKKIGVPKNGLKMEDVPLGLYITLIHIFHRTILNHHKKYIFSECMKLLIQWVEDLAVDVPFLFAKKLHHILQESKVKRVKYNYLGTLQKNFDQYRPNIA